MYICIFHITDRNTQYTSQAQSLSTKSSLSSVKNPQSSYRHLSTQVVRQLSATTQTSLYTALPAAGVTATHQQSRRERKGKKKNPNSGVLHSCDSQLGVTQQALRYKSQVWRTDFLLPVKSGGHTKTPDSACTRQLSDVNRLTRDMLTCYTHFKYLVHFLVPAIKDPTIPHLHTTPNFW